MADCSDDASRMPEKFRNHCMIGKYEYETIDKDTGE